MTLLFTVFLFARSNIIAQTPPTTSWNDFATTQWYNTQNATFTISTAEELAGLSILVAGGNSFIGIQINLAADIDLAAHLWTPIGVNNSLPFSGQFDGSNHVIRNLFVDLPTNNYVGLFGRCISAQLMNIRLENPYVRGEDSAGALVGNMWKYGTIENCHATGIDLISSGDNVGGLVGDLVLGNNMSRCSAEGSVSGNSQVGGLLGSPYDGNTIKECFSKGTVTANHIAGGLIGTSVVGFPGTTNSLIENCYSRSNVTVYNGIAGGFCGGFTSLLEVNNSYSTGTATGPEFIGGFLGTAQGVITTNNYWDSESSAHIEAIGQWQTQTPGTADITSKTTVEMKTTAMVSALNQGGTVWTLNTAENDGYPSFVPAGTASVSKNPTMQTQLVVYPTAFDTDFKIESESILKSYLLLDNTGKIIQSGSLEGTNANVNVSTINSGIYILFIHTESGTISRKIIKQ